MRITRIKLDTPFNCLAPFEQVFILPKDIYQNIDPKCLVGPNGSGKSNLLELLADIFFYAELVTRPDLRNKTDKYIKSDHVFELDYQVFDDKDSVISIRIANNKEDKIIRFYKLPELEEIVDIKKIKEALPRKIIGYSSGENESLSYRFKQLEERYAGTVYDMAKRTNQSQVLESRMIFMDYDKNAAIYISNYIFGDDEDLKYFRNYLNISQLESFRININLKRKKGSGSLKYVILTDELEQIIEKLVKCSYRPDVNEQEKQYILDYKTNGSTLKAFRHNFSSAYELYIAFEKLSYLNRLNLDKKYRTTFTQNVLEKPPVLGSDDLVFGFENIYLNLSNPPVKDIPYIRISDGEHQFMQIIGAVMIMDQKNALFLLDEPETHFNPDWRSNLIYILNQINNRYKDRRQEFFLTTHSPYVVSDCNNYNVFVFNRQHKKIAFEQIGIQTYGTSFDNLLKKAFDLKYSISQKAYQEILELLKSDNIGEIQERLDYLGPSFEKLALLKHLNELISKKEKK